MDGDLYGVIVFAYDAVWRGRVHVKIPCLNLNVFIQVPSDRAIGAILIEDVVTAVRAEVREDLVVYRNIVGESASRRPSKRDVGCQSIAGPFGELPTGNADVPGSGSFPALFCPEAMRQLKSSRSPRA